MIAMKKLVFIIAILSILVGCKKGYVITKKDPGTILNSLPLSDTSLIGDTSVFYDCQFGNSRELSIMPLGPCIIWGSKYIGFVYDFTSTIFGYDCIFTTNDSLSKVRLEIKLRTIDFSSTDTSFTLRKHKAILAFSPNTIFNFTPDLNHPSSVIISRYDSLGNLWSSNLGSTDQTGSSFQIIKQVDATHAINFRCLFNCTLYDKNGNSITIKNGRMGMSMWL